MTKVNLASTLSPSKLPDILYYVLMWVQSPGAHRLEMQFPQAVNKGFLFMAKVAAAAQMAVWGEINQHFDDQHAC